MSISKLIIFLSVFLYIFMFSKLVYSNDAVQVSNNQSPIVLHDGLFGDGFPHRAMMDDNKRNRYFYGNWKNNKGFANFSSLQTKYSFHYPKYYAIMLNYIIGDGYIRHIQIFNE